MLVTALKGLKVIDVACGSGDAQTLAVTENGRSKTWFFIKAFSSFWGVQGCFLIWECPYLITVA